MSRSYKNEPFQAICGNRSAKQDKTRAHRGERCAHRHAIKTALDFEDFLLPHKYECTWNETYCWGRDGKQNYCGLTAKDWGCYVKAINDPYDLWYNDPRFVVWPPVWYQVMMRK